MKRLAPILICIIVAVVAMVVFTVPSSARAADAEKASIKRLWKDLKTHPLVMAHRGDHRKAPENTIIAYEKAIEAGAHFIEVDVRLTLDNHWVVYHNRVITLPSGTRRVLSSLTFAQIRALSINGKRHGLPDQQIPTLHEVLEALRGKAILYLDDKMGRPLELAEIIREHGMEDQVVIGINDYADAILMSEFAKDVAWRGRVRPISRLIDNYLALKPKILEINDVFALTPAIIERIHKAGVKIMVNAEGSRESDKYYSIYVEQIGADIIQTDNLDRLFAFLKGLETA